MIDLGASKFSTEKANSEGVKCVLRDPNDDEEILDEEGNTVAVWVVGSDSKKYKRFQSEIETQFRGKKAPSGGKARFLARQLLVKCTLKFDNISYNGVEVIAGEDSALDFYTNVHWAREFVDEFIHERANFLGN